MSILLETRNLKKYFPVIGGIFKRKIDEVQAVDGVDIKIEKGECFGLVGESGCGKSTLGRTLVRLLDPTAGHIFYDVSKDIKNEIITEYMINEIIKLSESGNSHDKKVERLEKDYCLSEFEGKRLKKTREKIQIVFQDPATSLNPRMLVKDIIGEPLDVHGMAENKRKRVVELLVDVGLGEEHLYRYPHEFSGGQRQRIAIARALAVNPELLILDEPTSALDVSVQAQLINLLQRLQEEHNLTYLFITHDLSVAEYICDRVAVMYLGKIIEQAPTEQIFQSPKHPYTSGLISSAPIPDPKKKRKVRIEMTGEVPSPRNPPTGCRFHPRCPFTTEICKEEYPPLEEKEENQIAACWHPLD